MDTTYHFVVSVKGNDGKRTEEHHSVSERGTEFGAALALGKVVSFYEGLKQKKEIVDFRVMEK